MRNRPSYYTFVPPADGRDDDDSPTAPPAAAADLDEVGGKALSLIEAAGANFPVPPGLVLTVEFFEPWRAAIEQTGEWKAFLGAAEQAATAATATTTEIEKEPCDAVVAVCPKILELTDEQRERIDEALHEVFGSSSSNDLTVSVRSSSPEEDLASSSFAGGYHTTLGVRCGSSADPRLKDALVASFASMYDHRIVSYKIKNKMSVGEPRIAVIIQQQIDSEVSGVAFSINPQNNCYDETVVTANVGLGESVVGGTVTPDLFVVDRSTPTAPKIVSKEISDKAEAIWLNNSNDENVADDEAAGGGTQTRKNENPTEPALDDDQVLEVAELCARVEALRRDDRPVDIEWAYEKGELYLLQARPVTAYIPLFPELVTKRGEEKNLYLDVIIMSQGFSEPMSVLGLDFWGGMLRRVKPGFSLEGAEGTAWHIHGREYLHISNFMKSTGGRAQVDSIFRNTDRALDRALSSINLDDYVPSSTPPGVKGLIWLQLKQLFKMVPSMLHGLLKGEDAMAQYLQWSEDMMRTCHDADYLKDEPFDVVTDSILDKLDDSIPMLGGMMSGLISRWRLHRLFSGCKGADDLLISLCMDLSGNPTSEMGHTMVRLASFPEVQQTETGQEFTQKLSEDGAFSAEFISAYNDYMKRFGCRGMKEIDMASPRTYENQEEFFSKLKSICVEKNAILSVVERRKEAYEKLRGLAKDMGKESSFEYHANIIQRLLGYREHPKYMIVVMVDMLRRRALKIGDQFVEEQRLERADQIFHLKMKQIVEAQANKDLELLPLIESNLEPYRKVESVKNWPVLIDSRGKIIRGVRKQEDLESGVLVGDPISPGVVKARAKVLHGPYEKRLESGEILVARFTEPSWTPIFINAAAVVMEIGGPLQHGSIIAREYGIPCVSGVDDATHLIKDGDMIEVDGVAGTVKILDPEPVPEPEPEAN